MHISICNPTSQQFEEIVEQCEGCNRIIETVWKKRICACHCFPHTQWWFGDDLPCPQATHINKKDS